MTELRGTPAIKPNHSLVSYILFQRTEFLRLGNISLLKRLLPYNLLVEADARLFPKKVLAEYEADIKKEWNNIRPYLPKNAKTTLDIGCGVGFINAFLFQEFNSPSLPSHHYLVDRDRLEEKVYYEFEANGAAYNCLSNSQRFLESKGVSPSSIHTINVEKESLPENVTFDVILSLLSWGYHYPLETYLEYATKTLKPGGALILDCNVRTNARKVLQERFEVTLIKEEPTYHRLRAQHRLPAMQ